jgi:3-deoxy-D-manno-octulosonic acid (KDO) 8-phosphate synthase
MRVAGADNSTSNYDINFTRMTGTTLAGSSSTNQTSGRISDTVELASTFIYISNPFDVARPTSLQSFRGRGVNEFWATKHKVNASFDGITFFFTGSTTSATAKVYGFKD